MRLTGKVYTGSGIIALLEMKRAINVITVDGRRDVSRSSIEVRRRDSLDDVRTYAEKHTLATERKGKKALAVIERHWPPLAIIGRHWPSLAAIDRH